MIFSVIQLLVMAHTLAITEPRMCKGSHIFSIHRINALPVVITQFPVTGSA